jgi:pyruvate dehydrogenase E1 component alpha subunit
MSSLLAGSPGADALEARNDPRMVRLLTADGARVPGGEYERWAADLSDQQLLGMYEDMVVVRRIDTEATAL